MPSLSTAGLKLSRRPVRIPLSFIGQHLSFVGRQQALDRFDLENDLVLNYDVKAIAAI